MLQAEDMDATRWRARNATQTSCNAGRTETMVCTKNWQGITVGLLAQVTAVGRARVPVTSSNDGRVMSTRELCTLTEEGEG
jgi:hypothetical protein